MTPLSTTTSREILEKVITVLEERHEPLLLGRGFTALFGKAVHLCYTEYDLLAKGHGSP
jgi:hypothetical protein